MHGRGNKTRQGEGETTGARSAPGSQGSQDVPHEPQPANADADIDAAGLHSAGRGGRLRGSGSGPVGGNAASGAASPATPRCSWAAMVWGFRWGAWGGGGGWGNGACVPRGKWGRADATAVLGHALAGTRSYACAHAGAAGAGALARALAQHAGSQPAATVFEIFRVARSGSRWRPAACSRNLSINA